jgi:hypothetical protein
MAREVDMSDVEASLRAGEPTDAEVAAAVAAVHLALRRRGQWGTGGSRWMRAGRAESVAARAEPAGWATIERPW